NAELAAPVGGADRHRARHLFTDAAHHRIHIVHDGDHGHMIAYAHAAIGAGEAQKCLAHDKSPRPRRLSTLCICTCRPWPIAAVATPMTAPYFRIGSPAARSDKANLCPIGISSITVRDAALCGAAQDAGRSS